LLRKCAAFGLSRRWSSTASQPIVVLGSVCMDNFILVDRLPHPGETLRGDPLGFERQPGGKGANQAAGCANLGCPTMFVGAVGLDDDGPVLRAALAEFGIQLDVPLVRGIPSGQGFVMLQKSGENSIVIIQGANMLGWQDGCAHAADHISAAKLLMLQREIPGAVNLEAAQYANAAGVPVMMDVGGDPSPLPADLAETLTLVAPNETELSLMTEMPTDNDDQISSAVAQLQRSGVKEVLVTLGQRGSILFDQNQKMVHQSSFNVDNVVDTTGAGDCFRAGFAVARYHAGRDTQKSMQYGAAAAALLVQNKGAMTPPTSKETLQFLAKHDCDASWCE